MPRNAAQRRAIAACLNEVWAMEENKLEQIRGFLELRASGLVVAEDEIQAAMETRGHSIILAMDGEPSQQDNGRFIVDGVEVLGIFGTLAPRMNLMMRYSGGTSTQQFGLAFDRAMRDSEVHTIFIEVDSPGGAMSGTQELADKIYAARGKKRIVAVARGMIASAAYYIGTAADELIATPSTEGGSIGVYAITRESTARHELEGDKYYVWRAGEVKAAGNPYEKVGKAQAEALQARVDSGYRMFLAAVSRHRGVSVETVQKEFGQGTMFDAAECLARGMIDRVDSIEAVFDEERQRAAAAKKQTTQTATGFAQQVLPSTLLVRADEVPDAMAVLSATGLASVPPASHISPDLRSQANYPAAAATNPPIKPSPKPPVTKLETSTMNPRIKAALFAQGLIASMEASDEVCQAALSGYFRGNVPKAEDDVLKQLNGQTADSGATGSASAPPATGPAPNVQAAREQELAEARAAAELQGAQRVIELQSRAALLNKTGFPIAEAQVKEAIDKNWSVAQAVDTWTKVEGKTDPEKPIAGITAGPAEADKFVAAAADALLLQALPGMDRSKLAAGATELAGERTMSIVRRDMQHRGLACRGNDEEVASQWLRSLGDFVPMAAASSTTAADYPNLLAGFVDKRLQTMLRLQAGKFRIWCGQEPSVPDLNARLVIGQSEFGRLDDIEGDDGELPQDRTSEKALAWFKAYRKGKATPLTPIMVTQDQLGAFANRYALLSVAAERTINDMAVDLLVSNPVSIEDNVALWDAAHGTIVASGSGGVPSAAQAKLMRLRLRKQVGIATSDHIEAEPFNILVPTDLEDEAKQTYYKYERLNEVKVPVSDTTINVHRGTAEVIPEGRLDQYSTSKWYGLADPALWPVIKYVFQTGYENGRRRSWYDASRDTRYFGLESRAATFLAGWRGGVENYGS